MILFLGDIMLGRGVAETIDGKGYDFPFREILTLLHKQSYVVANLEHPLTNAKTPNKKKNPHLIFKSPPEYVQVLKQAGINIVTLANNHITDYGLEGIEETCNVLKGNGIYFTGAGRDLVEATIPVEMSVNGMNIGLFAFNDFIRYVKIADKKTYGVAPFNETLINSLMKTYETNFDYILFSVHCGIDYFNYPIPAVLKKLETLLMNYERLIGIICHHSHFPQPVLWFNKKFIICSLGNFLFDEPFPQSRRSYIVELDLCPNTVPELKQHFFSVIDDWRLILTDDEKEKKRLEILKDEILKGSDVFFEVDRNWIMYNLYYFFESFDFSILSYLCRYYSIFDVIAAVFQKLKKKVFNK
ncbi:MAG: CapA family protein [Ignavibacteria bacterium]